MRRSKQRSRARRWLAGLTALVLAAGIGVIPGASVAAAEPNDMVRDWNAHAVAALGNPLPTAVPPPPVPGAGYTPPVTAVHLAIVQGAVYDAVNAIDRRHEPYLRGLPSARRSASKAAAAATAAHHVLVGLVPALPLVVKNRLDTLYAGSLAEISNGSAKTNGIRIGAAVAKAMLKARANDGRFAPHPGFRVGTRAGQWRPTPPAFVNDPNAWVARVKPFTLRSRSQFRTNGPLALTSARYAAEFNEVKAVGSDAVGARTPAQDALARFYTANPLPMVYSAFREISAARGLSISQDARLFGMLSFASADAAIGCWDDKARWRFWRPITAIREAAGDRNPATVAQGNWNSFIPSPPYPDHPSGYNCQTGALMHTAKAFFGTDRVTISLTSPATMTTRTYRRLTAVIPDTINARIYQGIHFRTPDAQGALLGQNVARWVSRNFFERDD